MVIKTFRGSLDDGEQEEINLRTNKGDIGYKIVKFEILPFAPGSTLVELVAKVYTELQTAVTGLVNFSDLTNLAVAVYAQHPDTFAPGFTPVIFDNVFVNQNIYVTMDDSQNNAGGNYYLELEQFKLNENEATMATLQSIRSRYESYTPAGPS
jgi:hypothetical protein